MNTRAIRTAIAAVAVLTATASCTTADQEAVVASTPTTSTVVVEDTPTPTVGTQRQGTSAIASDTTCAGQDIMSLVEYVDIDSWVEVSGLDVLDVTAVEESPLRSGRGAERLRDVTFTGDIAALGGGLKLTESRLVVVDWIAESITSAFKAGAPSILIGVQTDGVAYPLGLRVMIENGDESVTVTTSCGDAYSDTITAYSDVMQMTPSELARGIASGEVSTSQLSVAENALHAGLPDDGVFDPATRSEEELADIRQVAVVFNIGGADVNESKAVCTESSLGMNECGLMSADSIELTVFVPEGETFSVVYVDFETSEYLGSPAVVSIPASGDRFVVDLSGLAVDQRVPISALSDSR